MYDISYVHLEDQFLEYLGDDSRCAIIIVTLAHEYHVFVTSSLVARNKTTGDSIKIN